MNDVVSKVSDILQDYTKTNFQSESNQEENNISLNTSNNKTKSEYETDKTNKHQKNEESLDKLEETKRKGPGRPPKDRDNEVQQVSDEPKRRGRPPTARHSEN